MNEPTATGKLLWPPDGRYNANDEPGSPCTCEPSCGQPCKGACGCEACGEAWGDYLSSQ